MPAYGFNRRRPRQRRGLIGCFRLAVDYAQIAFDTINHALGDEHTAMPAQQMGVSVLHVDMAAGLAGGIGLNGGACGVLGAAIWLRGINRLKNGGKLGFASPTRWKEQAWTRN